MKNAPELLQRDTMDQDHLNALRFIEKFIAVNKYGPSYTLVAQGLHWGRERARLTIGRLCKSGFLVRPKGIANSTRLATEEEARIARALAWTEWATSLSKEERSAVLEAFERADRIAMLNGCDDPPETPSYDGRLG